MTTMQPPPAATPGPDDSRPLPTRFRAGEERGARIGRVLKHVGRVHTLDEELMGRIGEGFLQRDEAGRRLADAMGSRATASQRVTHRDLARRLEAPRRTGLEALEQFVVPLESDPSWLDRSLVEEGARVQRRLGRNAADVLLQLSLIGGYRFGGPTDLLVATGGLTGAMTRRRLAETQQWAIAIAQPGALRPYEEGWRLTAHVRAMHALVDARFSERWDVARFGYPINQTDQAATLGLFDGTLLLGVRALGVPVSRADSAAVMHLWRYVGWLMGVDEQWLVESERERHRLNYHLLHAQGPLTAAGPQLAQAIVETLGELPHGRWQRARTLSMMSVFLGGTSLRELGLPVRLPWATALAIAQNSVRYRVLGRGEAGRRRLERWGDRVAASILADYDDGPDRDLATLPG